MRERSPWLWMTLGALVGGGATLATVEPSTVALRNDVLDLFGYGGRHTDDSEHGRDLFHTGVDISGTKGGETYADFDARRDRNATTTLYRFGCLGDCSAIAAGYRWSVRHQIRQPAECIGLSWPSLEGCAAYISREGEGE